MKAFSLSLFLCLFIGNSVLAQAVKDKTTTERLIKRNKVISKEVDSIVEGIDLFLTGEKLSSKKNETTLVLSNRFDWLEGGDTELQTHFNVDIRLPNLEKKWRLKLSSYDDTAAGKGIEKNRVESRKDEENYGTSIEFINDLEEYKLSFRPRLQLSPVLGMSYLLKLYKKEQLAKDFYFFPAYSFYAKPEKGTGVFVSLNTKLQIGELSGLSFINEGEYTNFDNSFLVNNGLALNHSIVGKHIYMIHSLMFESTNRPEYHLEQIVLSSGFYHKIYYRVLHYAITPYFSFSNPNNFKGKFGVRFDLNVIF